MMGAVVGREDEKHGKVEDNVALLVHTVGGWGGVVHCDKEICVVSQIEQTTSVLI